MDESAIERLTIGQRACLRLVLEHKQTKQIARELGIAPDTVKQRLGIAMRTLGVDTRVQAALLLQRHERDVHPRGVYPSQAVAETDATEEVEGETNETPVGGADARDPEDGGAVCDLPSDHSASRQPAPERRHALTLGWMMTALAAKLALDASEPAGHGAGNRLPTMHRILLIVFIAVGSILSITGLVSAVRELALLRR